LADGGTIERPFSGVGMSENAACAMKLKLQFLEVIGYSFWEFANRR
jgi:hypothetical protein